jgi:hypothetical protein
MDIKNLEWETAPLPFRVNNAALWGEDDWSLGDTETYLHCHYNLRKLILEQNASAVWA